MLLVLTDILTCPRCGPAFGLVILADRLEHRRVTEGSLGCANCRELFPIRDGLAELRFPLPDASSEAMGDREASPGMDDVAEEAMRLAALLGVTGGPGVIVVAGDRAPLAGDVAALVPDIGAVAVGTGLRGTADREGTSRLASDHRLPMRDGSARGVALTGAAAAALLDEGARVVARGGRLVLDPAPPDAAGRLRALGLSVLLEQDNVVVASAPGSR